MKKGYYGLSYHYIRPDAEKKQFPRLFGNHESDFIEHVKAYQKHYHVLTPEETLQYSEDKNYEIPGHKEGVLITFDDGLNDHYRAAEILSDMGVKAFFFCPTCFVDGEPANPIIIHYVLYKFRVSGFVDLYMKALEACGVSREEHGVSYNASTDDHWYIIKVLKNKFKTVFKADIARKVLLWMYDHGLKKVYENPLEVMHLNEQQIREMAAMGHEFGGHSHTHASVALHSYDKAGFQKEVIRPQQILSEITGREIYSISYPFGRKTDSFTPAEMMARTDKFKLAYTIEKIMNKKDTPALELGRYMPTSRDSADDILSMFKQIKQNTIAGYDQKLVLNKKDSE